MVADASSLVPPRRDATSPTVELHPRLMQQLLSTREEMSQRGELHSVEKLAAYYGTFRGRFGPDVLRGLDGEALLHLMHGRSNRDSLVYWLEFKGDAEFPEIFGSIAGGSALKFGLYLRSETGAWMTGSGTVQREISVAEAVGLARAQRDELVAACAVLEAFVPDDTDAAYQSLQETLSRVGPNVCDAAWGRKYLSLLFPDKLDEFHAPSYQRFNLIKVLQVPPTGNGRYTASGRFVALARLFQWPMNHLMGVMYVRHGRPHRYWRIGTRGDDGQSYWPMMQQRGVAAIGWSRLGDLAAAPSDYRPFKEAVRAVLAREYPTTPSATGRAAQQFTHFCRTIQEGDCVVAADGAKMLGIGRVRGGYEFDGTQGFPHMRPVDWLDAGEWKLPTTEGLQTTVHECKEYPENLVAIERRLIERTAPPPPEPRPPLPGRSTLWTGGGTIGRVQDVLERKGQVILYGPPGTGKTHWAEGAARQLAALRNFGCTYADLAEADRSRILGDAQNGFVRFCCFHPAYGYEDFIEGYRPVSRGNVLHFELHDGLFKRLCDAAAAEPGTGFYLVIDEINRGDIPRIFGELLTLLEKSKRGLRLSLPLSGREFAVPPNVFVIGTMNTADRSIALLDAALRRRFGFVELMPDSSVLGNSVVAGIPLGPWLDALNRLITKHAGRDGRNLQVGHSYLLHDGRAIDDLARLAHVLLEDVLPLLEEYCYDDWETLGRILGPQLVDVAEGRFRLDVFAPGRQEALVQALLASVPEVSASAIAVAADQGAAENPDDTEGESEGEGS